MHTGGRWLRSFDRGGVDALLWVNERLVGGVIEQSNFRRLTFDVERSVVSTGLQLRGHGRIAPSYYPITAYEANTG